MENLSNFIDDNKDMLEVVDECPKYIKYVSEGGNCSNHEYFKKNEGVIGKIYKVESTFIDDYGISYICELPDKVALRASYCIVSTEEEYLLQTAKKRNLNLFYLSFLINRKGFLYMYDIMNK